MTSAPGYADLLAHHALVQTLPAVVPMVLLVGAFAGIVVADRRRSRREAATLGQGESQGREPTDVP